MEMDGPWLCDVTGRLDEAGNFVEDLDSPPFYHVDGEIMVRSALGESLYLFSPDESRVFEYRSGRLIECSVDNWVIPVAGTRVLPFSEYSRAKKLRIYNFPGTSVKATQPEPEAGYRN